MVEDNEENIVVKEILNQFFNDVSGDRNIPKPLVEAIESLRNEKKLTKGDHLKELLVAYNEPGSKNEI